MIRLIGLIITLYFLAIILVGMFNRAIQSFEPIAAISVIVFVILGALVTYFSEQ